MANSQLQSPENLISLCLLVLTGKVIEMGYWFWPILGLLAGLINVLGSGGIGAVLAENLILKQQLLVMRRSPQRTRNLRTADLLWRSAKSSARQDQVQGQHRLDHAGVWQRQRDLARPVQ